MDAFLRSGFRVGRAAARDRLNQLASDVLDGIASVDQSGADLELESSSALEPKRAAAHLFGRAAGSALRGGGSAAEPRRSSPWNFISSLGAGFGSGSSKIGRAERNAVLTGKGMYLAYWHWHQYVEEQSRVLPHPAVDRGLGTMIWLGSGADPVTAASIAHSFSSDRRPDVWKGLGFALAFLDLCGFRPGLADTMLKAAGPMATFLVDGVAFGAYQRERLQDIDWHIDQLCRQLTSVSAAALVRASQSGFSDWE
jgi:hypothetical protein